MQNAKNSTKNNPPKTKTYFQEKKKRHREIKQGIIDSDDNDTIDEACLELFKFFHLIYLCFSRLVRVVQSLVSL